MAKPKPTAYSAVFFKDSDMDALRLWFHLESGLEVLPIAPQNPHSTIAFKPTLEEVSKLPLGHNINLRIVGWVSDEKVQAVVVQGLPSDRSDPHITIALAHGVEPSYSKELLAKGHTETQGPSITGKLGYYNGKVRFVLET